jgi:hypothetical protein
MLSYDTQRVWKLLDEAGTYWQHLFCGSPSYETVFKHIEDTGKLRQDNPQLYNEIRQQIQFNEKYEYDNFEALR